jgi:hypothetical protein
MAAGDSARHEAETSLRHAVRLRAAAREQERRARSFRRGSGAEQRTADLLDVLRSHGFSAVHDLSWPGTRRANIDHVVVGAPGVFVIDTKDWSGRVSVVGGRLYCGEVERSEALDLIRAQADAVHDVLAEAHLAPSRVTPVIALHGSSQPLATADGTWVVGAEQLPRELIARPGALQPADVDRLRAALEQELPHAGDRAHRGGPAAVKLPQPTAEALEPQALFSSDDLAADALRAAAERPLEDWLVFLHPDQLRHVRRTLNGPGRITGPAGTGKTVIAMHRLAHLAERGAGRLLYVTFTRTIPAIVQTTYRRLSPYTVDQVEFAGLHQWAAAFLRSRQLAVPLDPGRAETLWSLAWIRHRAQLAEIADHAYWRDEVTQVIRGRGLTTLDQYLAMDRPGRGIRLDHQQRRIVWSMAEHYRERLLQNGTADFDDLLRIARDEVRREPPDPGYDAVVLDEAQDISQLAAELLHALVGDRPNGLLFLGDDHQRVYAGGFRPSDCGIDVVGRSVRLTVNYRNTTEILDYATTLATSEDVGLLDDPGAGTTAEAVRRGPEPEVATFGALDRHDPAFVAAVRTALDEDAADLSLAVLNESTTAANVYLRLLQMNGVPALPLKDWTGGPCAAVLVGTIKRAKGLEFNRVFLPSVAPELLSEPLPGTSDAALVRWRCRRRELGVGLTRSRRHLWVGSVVPPAGSGSDVFQDPIAVDPNDTSVAGVVEAALGLLVSGGPPRFAEPGWAYESRLESLACDACGNDLHVCRRSVLAGGRQFKDWALVCATCLTSVPPHELGPANRQILAQLRHVR